MGACSVEKREGKAQTPPPYTTRTHTHEHTQTHPTEKNHHDKTILKGTLTGRKHISHSPQQADFSDPQLPLTSASDKSAINNQAPNFTCRQTISLLEEGVPFLSQSIHVLVRRHLYTLHASSKLIFQLGVRKHRLVIVPHRPQRQFKFIAKLASISPV